MRRETLQHRLTTTSPDWHKILLATAVLILFSSARSLSSERGVKEVAGITDSSRAMRSLLTAREARKESDEHSFPGGETAMYATGAAAITAGLIHFDQQTFTTLYRWKQRNSFINRISPTITNFGNGTYSAGLFGAYYVCGMMLDREDVREVGTIGIESFGLSGITVQLLKYLSGREQPNMATAPRGRWYGPFSYFHRNLAQAKGIGSYDAFPSGHTATVFAAAATIADAYREPWISYASYSLAGSIAISRVMEQTHWLSDCFVGGIIGVVSTRLIEKWNAPAAAVTIQPTAIRESYGVNLAVNF